jgi:hypothetical protein
MQVSDWVLICSTLFLGAVALFVPYLAEIIKRKCFAPKLKVEFELKPPDCHKTMFGNKEPVYYFRFRVTNIGKSQARRCEAVIEKLYQADAAGNLHQIKYSPVNLIWGSSYGEYVDINPERIYYCDLFNIPSKTFQEWRNSKHAYVNPMDTQPFILGLILDVKAAFFSQPNRLPPGQYKIVIGVFSENCPKITQVFKVSWSGNWKDTEDVMLKEAVVELI